MNVCGVKYNLLLEILHFLVKAQPLQFLTNLQLEKSSLRNDLSNEHFQ